MLVAHRQAPSTLTGADAWIVLRVSPVDALVQAVAGFGQLRPRRQGKVYVPVAAAHGSPEVFVRLLGWSKLPRILSLPEAADLFGEMVVEPDAQGWVLAQHRALGVAAAAGLSAWASAVTGGPVVLDAPLPVVRKRHPKPHGVASATFTAQWPGRCSGCGGDVQAGSPARFWARKLHHESCAKRRNSELGRIRGEFNARERLLRNAYTAEIN